VVKVVVDGRGDALYFSRSLVPSLAHTRPGATTAAPWRRHLGIYAFRPDALERFATLPTGELEALENLEQLRWLEAGRRMRVLAGSHAPRGIDTQDDYAAFVARWRAGETSNADRSSVRDPSTRKGWVRT
jgi:3-deoxy-manno-octulosonate cytidylyltransferase (CMP-KDO synthetase)